MILDQNLEFASEVVVSQAGAGTTVLGDVIDIDVARDLGNGREVFWYVFGGEDAGAGGTSANFQLTAADNAALSSNPVVIAETGVILTAALLADAKHAMLALPLEGLPYKRYLGVRQVVVGTFTGGTVTSGLTLDPMGWKAYPAETGV